MKKTFIHILLSVNLLSLFVLSSFSTAKAESLTPGTISTYGSYYAETYYKNTNGSFDGWSLNLPFVTINLNNANSSVFHLHYDFNQQYSGYISVTVTTSNSYTLNNCDMAIEGGFFQSIPSKTTNSSSKTFQIGLYQSEGFDFYLAHKGASGATIVFQATATFTLSYTLDDNLDDNQLLDRIDTVIGNIYDYMTDDMETSFQGVINAINNSVDYEIPQERLYAYFMTKPNDNYPIVYENGDFAPYIHVTGGVSTTRIYRATAGKTFYFYYFSSNTTESLSSPNGVTVVNKNIDPVLNGYRLKCAEITNSTQNDINDTLTWSSNANIIPVYFGDGKDMTQEMQSLTHHQSETYTTSILTQILNAIRSLVSENTYDTSTYDDGVDDAGDFLDNVTNTIPSINPFQNDINSIPAFTGNGTHLDEMSGFVGDVYTGVTNVFPFVKTFIILGAVVLIMKVFL